MTDKRWERLADILVNWSVAVKPGEKVMIAMHEAETLPLTVAVYRAVIKAGAFPQVQFLSDRLRHALLKYGNEAQVSWIPEIEAYGMEWADVYFGLRGAHNLYELADIPTEILAKNQRAMGKVSALRWEKTRWVLARVPNESFAQQGHTDIETMMDMFFNSCFIDWEKNVREWGRIATILEQGSRLRLIGERTDLSFSVAGRKWVVGDGRISVPDGEIYTAPVETTLDGTIYYEFPGVLGGRIIDDIQLTWEKGRLVSAASSTNEDYLKAIISTDAGSSLIGEFGFGVNDEVNLFTTDILIDEKIGGTIHTALGRPYPICGGTYTSAIHWDIVKDTRRNSEIYLDEKLIFKNGKFLI
jgi:aminopeptidase